MILAGKQKAIMLESKDTESLSSSQKILRGTVISLGRESRIDFWEWTKVSGVGNRNNQVLGRKGESAQR